MILCSQHLQIKIHAKIETEKRFQSLLINI